MRVIYDPTGIQLDEPAEVDVASDERSIVEVVDERQLDVQTSDHL